MSLRDPRFLLRLVWAAIFIMIPVVSGYYSLLLGMDNNWDLLNYHYYNPYAFLNDRLDVDLAPGQMQTYLNPLLDLPFYYLVRNLSARAVGFVLGLVHGINLSLMLGIFLIVVRDLAEEWKLILGGLAVILAMFSPMYVAELGTTFNDNLTSLFILGGLILLMLATRSIQAGRRSPGFIFAALAGLSIGMGIGFKLVAFPYAVGAAAALPFLLRDRTERLKLMLIFGLAGLAGVLITSGFWFWEMWERFRNPIFPFFNNLFPTTSTIDVKSSIRARPLVRLLLFPLLMNRYPLLVAQVKFQDIRMFVVFLLTLMSIVVFILRKNDRGSAIIHRRFGNFIVVFFWVSFYTWLFLFPIYRYLLVLDVIVPILLLILVARNFRPTQTAVQIYMLLAVVILAIFNPPDWGRLGWNARFFMIEPASVTIDPESVVLMLGDAPTGFIVPDLPPTAAYLRVDGNMQLSPGDPLFEQVVDTIRSHDGEIYILYNAEDGSTHMPQILIKLGLRAAPERCDSLLSNHRQGMTLCEISRKGE